MDLRGMLNDNGPTASTPSKPPQPPPPPPSIHHPPSMPSTPVQTNAQQPLRDYSQTQPSPGRHIALDYGMQQVPPGAYASPPPYQTSSGPYPNRPAPPPPLQQIAPNDLRSPSITSGPGPSPYRQTPTSSISTASGGYPFPTQTPTSPVQRHQYPPPSAYHRDSYPQPSVPVGMTGAPAGVSYMQGQQVPQTPPVATPGHPFPHQRSHSTHSTPTPTSAQSQHAQYGAPFIQGSPVATHHPLPMDPQQRQSSQPPTPVSAPLSRPSQTMSFQPPSPYQQRLPATPAYPQTSQRSPPPPLPPPLPRHSNTATIYDPISQDSHRRSHSHGDRDRSISVSPKTRIPSLPSSAGRPGTSISDSDPRHAHAAPAMPAVLKIEADTDRAMTPAKRKLDDRELRPDELERREVRPPPFEDVNGRTSRPDNAPAQPPPRSFAGQKRRMVYQNLPVWARKLPPGQTPNNPNYTLYQPLQHSAPNVNGKPDNLSSRHASPEEKRTMPSAQQPQAMPPQAAQAEAGPAEGSLGPWEASITNEIPQGGMSKAVADFLFHNVILNPDLHQIQSNGVHFEIEAKLGTLLHKQTNLRIDVGALSECVLADSDVLVFRSSMSEAQHRAFNEFLNATVLQAHPDNKSRPHPRVPIKYKHRREIDKFFELPQNVRDRVLPACVSGPLSTRKFGAKVRVTYDQKTNEVLAKIVKARVADINLHFPESPFDCRISINLEMDWDGGVADLERMAQASNRPAAPNRNKDRLSYSHGHYQIDLTQVTQVVQGPNNYQRQEKEHELEIEVAPAILLDQGSRAKTGQPHQYLDLVDGFINNIRVLARKAKEFTA